jgi:NADPH-dependent 2,4-dienoyl-CoA reductase/sulfur reductase-like enzyme
MIEEAEIVYEHRAVAIDPGARTVAFANGRAESYDALVSTVPLPRWWR